MKQGMDVVGYRRYLPHLLRFFLGQSLFRTISVQKAPSAFHPVVRDNHILPLQDRLHGELRCGAGLPEECTGCAARTQHPKPSPPKQSGHVEMVSSQEDGEKSRKELGSGPNSAPRAGEESEDMRHVIIPLLLTLMSVLTKATGITEDLYHRAYTFCTRLLTLPAPYSTVALDCAIRLKTETAVPGTLYQRTVIAEQNLISELYPYQERVFLFVDPELVSASVCSALLLEIEAAQGQQTPEACMRHVVSHALQAALGEACHTGVLNRKLQASSRRVLEYYFHAVVAAIEQVASEDNPSRLGHLERMEEIYCSLLGPATTRRRCVGDLLQDRLSSIPMPSPYITFHLWTDQEQLWKELVLFLRPRSQLRLSADLDALDLQGFRLDRDLARVSTDSGIERDLPLGSDELPDSNSSEMERAALQRKGGIKKRVWPPDFFMPGSWDGPPGLHRRTGRPSGDGELLPGVSRVHTAHVLVLGDDRMLGRLAQAYYKLRKRETKKFCLTPRLSLQLYYIPVLAPQVTGQDPEASRKSELGELASFLGRVDPWYESTVNTLCPAILKLAEMIFTTLSHDPTEDIFLTELKVKIQDSKSPREGSSPRRRGAAEGPGAELSMCYQKALLSHRPRDVTVSLRATGLVLKAIPAGDTEVSGFSHSTSSNAASATDCSCLHVSVTEVVKSSNLAGRSFTTSTNTFRTSSIQVQSQDQRLLTLWLDKDSRRTFRDVVRFEAGPCPEPCSRTQKSKTSALNSHGQETDKNMAKPNSLLMPINTFSGIIQ
ncbi:phosphoinositide 3-kinase regulatory subunit 6 isoform X3 [Apodemus sylvaticus]|uniref:phosphoinositide 3-kinase regulatory subunit 6 isoform X3 n=1 Tax=Apodemus sylvaticus TaxID=10129 RepID=UPI00224188CE|nr:phosphoinositide 3-kinase regulatory subunit 6 isoform X3 [Apodemus sylvaticus]